MLCLINCHYSLHKFCFCFNEIKPVSLAMEVELRHIPRSANEKADIPRSANEADLMAKKGA